MTRIGDIERLASAALGTPVRDGTSVGGGDICSAARFESDRGPVFAKAKVPAAAGFFQTEAAGLRWLGDAGPVPEVLAVGAEVLVLRWHPAGPPTAVAAEQFGRDLAVVHRSGAPEFGSVPPGATGSWTGSLQIPLLRSPDAATHLAARLTAAADAASGRGHLAGNDRVAVESVISRLGGLLGPPEAASRLHGDLWAGNVHWTAAGPTLLIDPAAHGGHRETDLAMLYLFGAPLLDRIAASYQEVSPLSDGWRERIALHQLYPLLVHAALFGGGYGVSAGDAARRYL